jgi:DNA phosphorothioation-associated putative methyltransferase
MTGAIVPLESGKEGRVDQPLGKTVHQRLYLHATALDLAPQSARDLLAQATTLASASANAFNVVRFDPSGESVALLNYPDFLDEAFPPLERSWKVTLSPGQVTYRTYADSLNPPILHRKELLLAPDHPRRPKFAKLTFDLESLGFFDDPVRIGFKLQWEKLLSERGFRVIDHDLVPIGNDESTTSQTAASGSHAGIARHLTALTRCGFSAPVQLLHRHGFLDGKLTVFDYGCGKGDDMRGLSANGITAEGWDPHYAADRPIVPADVVNLGFVINVIEDPVERRDALRRAYDLTHKVLAVSVMVATEHAIRGTPFADGVITGRNTFQKYYTQSELHNYVEAAIGERPFLVAPGIVFVFKDKDAEQHFQMGRYRSHLRLRSPPRKSPRITEPKSRVQRIHRPDPYDQHRPLLDGLWRQCLDLGREPDASEIANLSELEQTVGSLRRVFRLIQSHYDRAQLEAARRQRADDLRVYLALQQFQKRQPYGHLEDRLQHDIKAFFGSHMAAQNEGRHLLLQAAECSALEHAAMRASEEGLGWLDAGASLQLASNLVSRLPSVLRAYVGCASVLFGDLEDVDLVKIHLASGKVTLMLFDDFLGSPLPRLVRRVKINLRTQDVDIFEYGEEYVPPFLYLKSRFLNEESEGYAEQFAFDESLQALRLFDLSGFGPSPDRFANALRDAHWAVNGFRLERLHYVPDLDAKCGRFFTYRQLVECGETVVRLKLPNIPTEPESYTALYDLATSVLDPVVEYFGRIELTYGFCSPELGRHIKDGVAPKLDQHAAHERTRTGRFVCSRLGAAVDFLVRDENMRNVVDWIVATVPFDRLYFYGERRPIHVSYGPEGKREVIDVVTRSDGRRIPRVRSVPMMRSCDKSTESIGATK